ncbi:DUF4221 family protein [Algoriphagus winogradskyi]|uniref:DUF4221 domain-containing protein n=1 Tax=Algoriphagus winogradskyi TaxID=237017 RepID=A0ABY1NRQ7_9BACT|nr:DUF4221 family protein [Algoriphagus winogradskyi]SMP14351.1 protein of unknown function [Algoriphagus winogradskyi]
MKKLLTISLLILLASCGGKESESTEQKNILENLTYSVDTVVVDPGEEIIDLSGGLRLSSLSDNKSKLYLFTQKEHQVAIVNLDQLKLEEFLPFEVEGPNGIGQYVGTMQKLDRERFLFSSFQTSGIYDRNGVKTEDLKLKPTDFEGIDLEGESPMNNNLTSSADGKLLFSLPGNFMEGSRDLAVLDLASRSGKIIDIPAMDKASEFRILLQSDKMMSIYIEEVRLQEIEGYLFINTSVTSDIYRYDYQRDSLQLITFPHQLVPSAKTGSIKNKVSSEDEWRSEMEKASSQIGFEKLLWDDNSQRFFRFGRKLLPKENEESPAKAEVYLFAYDAELKLIGEKFLEDIDLIPSSPFFKDGKLYSYVNVEDELGFAVFTFDF